MPREWGGNLLVGTAALKESWAVLGTTVFPGTAHKRMAKCTHGLAVTLAFAGPCPVRQHSRDSEREKELASNTVS